jgi:MtN3 and saliva related transmembrane protein
MSALTFLGFTTASCTTLAFIPQVIKAWKTRSRADISLGMFLIMCVGIVLWLVHGGMRGDVPLVIANVATLVLAGAILPLKLKHE